MPNVIYHGDQVNSVISNIQNISNLIPSISSSIKSATNKIVSAKGFSQYVGGISSNSFSSEVDQCEGQIQEYINNLRQKQISILSYSEDKEEINAFLNTLSNKDYSTLDLKELDSYIGLDRKAGNVATGIFSTIGTFGLGLLEGIGNLIETGGDLICLGVTGAASIFTGGYDLITGEHSTEDMWESTRAFVSEKHVESIFDSIYEDTEFGQNLKNNAYFFEGARSVGSGLGYTAGMIGLTVVTGGLASGLGVGATGSVGAGQLAATAGLLGFSSGTAEAWNDGAETGTGLLYGAASGAWNALQWYTGAKINQYGGLGDKIAKGIFKGAASGVGTRIAMDSGMSALDALVKPALTMIYKDYGQGDLTENYKTAFEAAGGWGNVGTQAFMGGISSTIGEFMGARRLLKSANAEENMDEGAKKVFKGDNLDSAGGNGSGMKESFDAVTDDTLANSSKKSWTIDGKPVLESDTCILKNSEKIELDSNYFKKLDDGSFVPLKDVSIYKQKGALANLSEAMSPKQAMDLLEQNKDYLSYTEFNKLKTVIDVFQKYDCDISVNELKLVAFHSEGYTPRIFHAINMSDDSLPLSVIAEMSDELSKKIFQSDVPNIGQKIKTDLMLEFFDDGEWTSARELYNKKYDIFTSSDLANKITNDRYSRKSLLPTGISDETVEKLFETKGYYPKIKEILSQDSAVSNDLLDYYSTEVAGRLFRNENLVRFAAADQASYGNINNAYQILGTHYYEDLCEATAIFSEKGNRNAYYNFIDYLNGKGRLDADTLFNAKQINAKALTEAGYDNIKIEKVDITDPSSIIFNYKNITPTDNSPIGDIVYSDFAKARYMNADGTMDTTRIAKDFTNALDHEAPSDLGGNASVSKTARSKYTNHFIDTMNDTNNPNREETIRFMTKVIEANENGKPLNVISIDGEGSYYLRLGNTINLDDVTLRDNKFGVFDHETGHMAFHLLLDDATTDDMNTLYRVITNEKANSILRLDSDVIDIMKQNHQEIQYYTKWKANQIVRERIADMGHPTIKSYIDELTQIYNNENTAWEVYDTMREELADKIYRQEFFTDQNVSGMVNSLTDGEISYSYGHSKNYFNYYDDGTPMLSIDSQLLSFDELIAQYSAFKLGGNNRGIRLLKQVIGEEMVDFIGEVYEGMLE